MQLKTIRKSILATSLVTIAALVLSACAPSNTSIPNGSAIVNGQPDELTSSNGKLDVTLTAAETMVPFGNSTR